MTGSPKITAYKAAVGIRYQANFKLEDVLGAVVQDLVKGGKSPFAGGYFENVLTENATRQKLLKRKSNESYLSLTPTDLIFENFFEKDAESEFEWMLKDVVPYLVDKVLRQNGVGEILRVGIIFGYKADLSVTCNQLISEFTQARISTSENFMFRFSKKLPVDMAWVKKGVDDFKNLIVTVQKREAPATHLVDFDIQQYFRPQLDHLEDFDFVQFFRAAKTDLLSDYQPLLDAERLVA